jgi:hypothetical protein
MGRESVFTIHIRGEQPAAEGGKDLRKNTNKDKTQTTLPSEFRYSASLILGLGIVHVILGVLSLSFSILAVIFEPRVNYYACGTWTAPFHVLCGIFGIYASTRWYINYQIIVFLVAAVASMAASVVCVYLTAAGIHFYKLNILLRMNEQANSPYIVNLNGFREDYGVTIGVATYNVIITACLEFLLSLTSTILACQGSMSRPYNFSPTTTAEGSPDSNSWTRQDHSRSIIHHKTEVSHHHHLGLNVRSALVLQQPTSSCGHHWTLPVEAAGNIRPISNNLSRLSPATSSIMSSISLYDDCISEEAEVL